ncbi:MAG: sensor histidine kinase [Bacteroidota bacterium]
MHLIDTKYKTLNRIINNRPVQHVTYWVLFVSFFGFIWGTYDMDFRKTFAVELINLPIKMFLVYFTIYFLFPKFLYRKKYLTFVLLLIITLLLSAIFQRFTDNYFVLEYFSKQWTRFPILDPIQILINMIYLLVVLAIPAAIKLGSYIADLKQKEQEIEKEKLKAELQFLKSQVHPHFLFNTLNSLYSLVLKKSDKSENIILKLSELLRYMLYETNANSVELNKEIASIKSYVELEKMRHGEKVDLSLNIWGDTGNQRIAPMLLLPFIENSFKHSTKSFDGKAWITIELGVNGHELTLKVENSITKDENEHEIIHHSGGIGMKNARRRLSLLYPDNHKLDVSADRDSYMIILKISLTEEP